MEEIILKGTIEAVLPRGEFKVKLLDMDASVHCRPSGKIRKYYIKMTTGDKVMVRVSSNDISKGVIVFRGWNKR